MNKLTKEQAVIISGYTGIACCNFGHIHEDVEKRLGRPVYTHEFASEKYLRKSKNCILKILSIFVMRIKNEASCKI